MARKAGMSTGVEVARISVKVSPDTKQFRRELKDELEDIEKSYNKTGSKKGPTVDVDANTDKVDKKVDKLTDDISKRKAKLRVDTDPIDKSIASMRKNLETMNLKWDNKVKDFLDPAKTDKSIASMRKNLETMNLKWDNKVKDFLRGGSFEKVNAPKFESAQIRSETNRIVQDFEIAWQKTWGAEDRLSAALHPDLKWWNPHVIRGQIRNMFGEKPIEVPVELDVKKGGKGGGGIPNLPGGGSDGRGKWMPGFGSGINPGGWVAIAAGVLTAAQPVIGIISAALTALPGLVALVAAPIAAITLGLDGFKKAAETIKPQFESLKTTMSAAAETSFGPVMKQVADSIFPKLQASLPGVTRGLADIATGFLDGFKDNRLTVSISRIGAALSAMKPGFEGFGDGINSLIDSFTAKLPDITAWFNKAGQGFSDFFKNIDMSTVFDNLGAAATTVLDVVTELGQKGLKFMSEPGAIDGFLGTLKNIGDALQNIADLSGKINEKWDQIFGRNPADIGKDAAAAGGEGLFGEKLPAQLQALANSETGNGGTKAEVDKLAGSLQAVDKNAKQASISVAGVTGKGSGELKVGGGAVDPATQGAANDANKIPPPDDTEAKAKLAEYQTFVSQVSTDVQTAMKNAAGTQGGTVPPPNFDAFKAAWNELPNVINQATQGAITAAQQLVNGCVTALQGGGNLIVASVQQWQNGILTALAPMYQIGLNAGTQLAQGMANGISAGTPFIAAAAMRAAMTAKQAAEAALGIKSPSRVFMKIGDQTMQGMGLGMENGLKPVVDQAKDMAGKIAKAFEDGGDPTGLLNGFSKGETSRMEKVLGFESKKMGWQAKVLDRQFKATGNQAFKDQADVLRGKMDEIAYQKESLDLAQEFADLQGGGESDWKGPIAKMLNAGAQMPFDFVSANADQFMSDVGMSGGGALGGLMDYGKSLASSFVFNVGNMEDALTAQQTLTNRQALGVVPR